MIEGIPRISVLIICFKQEELIKRAINSLLVQKDYIYEICVSDDCSPDRTWEVLQEYDRQYPGLFKLHRNEPNVGIFENFEYTWTMPTGDIIYHLSGDDECGEGWFRTVVEYIQKNQIDYKTELFCIYGNIKSIYPNGDVYISSNNRFVTSYRNVFSMAFRGHICNRTSCYSINILKQFKNCSQGRSHIAEEVQERQLQLITDKNYYIPIVGNIYYTNIGVSTQLSLEIIQERKGLKKYALEYFECQGFPMSKKDRQYAVKFFPELEEILDKRKPLGYVKLLLYMIWYQEFPKATLYESIKSLCFSFRRRLPHKRPIRFE